MLLHLTMAFLVVFLALLCLSSATTTMTVTQAGRAPFVDIVQMRPGLSPTVCVQSYANGISVRCGGTSVRAPVTFFVNGRRGRTVSLPPFQIAGAGDDGNLREIYSWTSFKEIKPRIDGTRLVSVECRYTDKDGGLGNFTRSLTIAEKLCDAHLYDEVVRKPVPHKEGETKAGKR